MSSNHKYFNPTPNSKPAKGPSPYIKCVQFTIVKGCGNSDWWWCEFIVYTWFPSCLVWGGQCRQSCFLCWIPNIVGGVG